MSRHRAPRTTRRRGLLTVAVAALAVLGLALPAAAFFSVGSTAATGASRAGTLGTPGATTSGVTATTVTFTITAPPTGPAPTAYRVARTAPSVTASVCTVSGSAGTCSDTAPVDGQTNTYAVYARISGTAWESVTPRTLSVAVPAADATAPVTTASASPAPNAAGWNSTNVAVTLTATDASGVAATYYTTDGSAPTTASTVYAAPFTVASTATVRYFSVDTRGNVETAKSLALRIDAVAPTGAVTAPAATSVVGGTVTVSGTSSDANSGVASVQPQYQAAGATGWTNLSATTAPSPFPASLAWSASWATGPLADGSYSLRAVVTDGAGNTFFTATVPVTVKNTFTASAPTSATAGSVFAVALTTTSNVTGTQPILVTGLTQSPNGTNPQNVPTTATFANGVATIQLTAVSATPQTITVTLTGYNRQASAAVTVTPRARLYISDCTVVTCSGTSSTTTVTAPKSNWQFKVSRATVDDYGNAISISSQVTVTLNFTSPVGNVGLSPTTLTIPANQTVTSGLATVSGNGQANRSGTFTASTGGYVDGVVVAQ